MGKLNTSIDRHCLFEACAKEALRIGGGESTAEYFFERAQTSRVWLSQNGDVTVADMAIKDWCSAIAWCAPGVGVAPPEAPAKEAPEKETLAAEIRANAPAKIEPELASVEPLVIPEPDEMLKQPRSGAKSRRAV